MGIPLTQVAPTDCGLPLVFPEVVAFIPIKSLYNKVKRNNHGTGSGNQREYAVPTHSSQQYASEQAQG